MADITLQREQSVVKTVVPNSFIDGYMIHANGEYVKVYLYLLRCIADPNMTFSISDCADKFDHTEKDIIRALKYWEKMHLIRLEYNEEHDISCICLTDCSQDLYMTPSQNAMTTPKSNQHLDALTKQSPAKDESAYPRASEANLPEKTKYSDLAIEQLKSENDDISQIIFIVEQYLGKPLSSNDLNSIIYWNEVLNMDNDLIDYLVENAVESGHKSIRYMEAIAIDWHKEGINSVEKAKAENEKHSALFSLIYKAFGISGRTLASSERDYVITWSKEYGFDNELILEACKRTINTIHQPDFRYADSILKNWKNSNVTTMTDVQAQDDKRSQAKPASKQPKKAIGNFSERTYSRQSLEKELLTYGTNQ